MQYKNINLSSKVLSEYKHLRTLLGEKLRSKSVLSSPVKHLDGSRCWIYTGGQTTAGYGLFSFSDQKKFPGLIFRSTAHRASYMIWVGKVNPGQRVHHHCDNPPCINPHHLYIGTARDNIKDAVSRRFFAHPLNRSWKLTVPAVHFIRQLLLFDLFTQREIAEAFSVSEQTISMIKNGKIYFYLK